MRMRQYTALALIVASVLATAGYFFGGSLVGQFIGGSDPSTAFKDDFTWCDAEQCTLADADPETGDGVSITYINTENWYVNGTGTFTGRNTYASLQEVEHDAPPPPGWRMIENFSRPDGGDPLTDYTISYYNISPAETIYSDPPLDIVNYSEFEEEEGVNPGGNPRKRSPYNPEWWRQYGVIHDTDYPQDPCFEDWQFIGSSGWDWDYESGTRYMYTAPQNVEHGGNITFSLRKGDDNAYGCESPNGGDDLVLQYTTPDIPVWVDIESYDSGGGKKVSIPPTAWSENTQFRLYQSYYSDCSEGDASHPACDEGPNADNWGMDDFTIHSASQGLVARNVNETIAARTQIPLLIGSSVLRAAPEPNRFTTGEGLDEPQPGDTFTCWLRRPTQGAGESVEETSHPNPNTVLPETSSFCRFSEYAIGFIGGRGPDSQGYRVALLRGDGPGAAFSEDDDTALYSEPYLEDWTPSTVLDNVLLPPRQQDPGANPWYHAVVQWKKDGTILASIQVPQQQLRREYDAPSLPDTPAEIPQFVEEPGYIHAKDCEETGCSVRFTDVSTGMETVYFHVHGDLNGGSEYVDVLVNGNQVKRVTDAGQCGPGKHVAIPVNVTGSVEIEFDSSSAVDAFCSHDDHAIEVRLNNKSVQPPQPSDGLGSLQLPDTHLLETETVATLAAHDDTYQGSGVGFRTANFDRTADRSPTAFARYRARKTTSQFTVKLDLPPSDDLYALRFDYRTDTHPKNRFNFDIHSQTTGLPGQGGGHQLNCLYAAYQNTDGRWQTFNPVNTVTDPEGTIGLTEEGEPQNIGESRCSLLPPGTHHITFTYNQHVDTGDAGRPAFDIGRIEVSRVPVKLQDVSPGTE